MKFGFAVIPAARIRTADWSIRKILTFSVIPATKRRGFCDSCGCRFMCYSTGCYGDKSIYEIVLVLAVNREA